jgi:1,4-dihydroxy-2-naphthoate octaprenyltransferase
MRLKQLYKAIKPFQLISLLLTYSLGVGLVQYVDEIRNWVDVWLGGIFLLLVTLSVEFLVLLKPSKRQNDWLKGLSYGDARRFRLITASLSATLLTIAVTIFIGWMVGSVLWQGLIFLILILVLSYTLYYLAQVLVTWNPFQILFEGILFVVLPPAFAYFLQSQDLHRLLSLVVIGLVPAYWAYRLLTLLKTWGADQSNDTRTIVTEIGWERSMTLHNALILLTFLLFAIVTLFGFPWFLLWPVFLVLPLGLLEIWLMERVRRGSKPLWTVMQIAAACVLFIPMYLVGFAFWIR